MDLSHVVVALARGRSHLHPDVRSMLTELIGAGALVRQPQAPSADVCLMRSCLISDTLQAAPKGRTVMLLLDDDCVAEPTRLEHLCKRARTEPVSGVYMRADRVIAATRLEEYSGAPEHAGRWLVGLGCCAVPLTALRDLRAKLPEIEFAGGSRKFYPFCTAGAWRGSSRIRWLADDYSLSLALGGFALDPSVPVGHVKPVPLWPAAESLAELEVGEKLSEAAE